MKANKIEQDKQYEISIGKNTTVVRVVEIEHRVNGTLVFQCENIKTGKPMTIAATDRFRKEVKDEKTNPTDKTANQTTDLEPESVKVKEPEDATETKTDEIKPPRTREDGKLSGINAAYEVLKEAGEPLNIKQIMERINQRNLASLAGKTPEATVSAAIQREINGKSESRFVKAGKGLFRVK